MVYCPIVSGDVALTFLGENIPVIGPLFKEKGEAMKVVRHYLDDISVITDGMREVPVQISLKKQPDGRYSLFVKGARRVVGKLYNLDELLLKRFCKGLKRKLFILTCFAEGSEELECLVLTEGLGAVFYTPGSIKEWRP